MNARILFAIGALLIVLAGATGAQKRVRRPGGGAAPRTIQLVPKLEVSASEISFGAVASGGSSQQLVTLTNTGSAPLSIESVGLLLGGAGTPEAWSIDLDGKSYAGLPTNRTYRVNRRSVPRESIPVTITFAPTEERYDAVVLRFKGQFGTLDVNLDGLGGHEGHPFLHVVINTPSSVVDYDEDGSELVTLDGSQSHTHEPGRSIVGYQWETGGAPFSTDPITSTTLALGSHQVDLTITDDNNPGQTLTDHADIDVLPTSAVPGVLAQYYDASEGTATGLLDAVPALADFGEVLSSFSVPSGPDIGGSSFSYDAMVRLLAEVAIDADDTYLFAATGGVARRLELDGTPVTGPLFLTAGTYDLEARFAVDDASLDLPLDVTVSVGGGPAAALDPLALSHDETGLLPVINAMPDVGIDLGGNLISIDGLGFFPASSVVVHWGAQDLDENDFSLLTPTRIEFTSPPGSGAIQVTVETAQGTSNQKGFIYSPTGPVPIDFQQALTTGVSQPTAATWGPDGRLYVTSLSGQITAIEFADDWTSVVSQTTYPGVSLLTNNDTLGITIDPYDPPSPVRLYVAHAEHFANGGTTFTGPSPYSGQISVLEGPNFDTPLPIVTKLPCSNHDHAVNGIEFDHNGDLFIAVGSNTNAGVRHPNSGDVPESPLSAAILKAELSKPSFNGVISYVDSLSRLPNDDQVFGEQVDVAPGVDVFVHAAGLRNPYDIVYSTKKRLFATDNGPNVGFGAASTGPTTEDPDPYDDDELLLIEWGQYYGHPNRSRGRYDARQNVYYGALNGPPSIPEVFTQQVSWLPPSSDGIDEYRASTFQGQIRGRFVTQEFLDDTRLVSLSDDGRRVKAHQRLMPFTGALGVVTGPGGAILALDFIMNQVMVLAPNDLSAVGLVPQDVFPWRAPATGGTPFTIGGVGFGDLSDTSVTIGGNPATLTYVSATRIEGFVPAEPTPGTGLVDIVVTVDTTSATLTKAFRYLLGRGLEPGCWEDLKNTKKAIGEVAAGAIDGMLYVVGEGSDQTFAYDLLARTWRPNRAVRPNVGHHHAAEVVDGLWYLIGGLGDASEGTVQIYDPVADSWTTGAPMSWAVGSLSTSVIDGKIYAAGGIVSTWTVNNAAVYDPVLDTWTAIAAMPDGRNHAAAGTDGTRLFLFGGRKGGNFVTNGYDTVFAYDPGTDLWESSDDVVTTLVPLPQARGGMGKAVWHRGEFFVFGGETLDGPGAVPILNVYDRVDVYDPATGTWRLEAPMASPRHGIFPVLFEGRVFLPGGGTQAGFSQSTDFDFFARQ